MSSPEEPQREGSKRQRIKRMLERSFAGELSIEEQFELEQACARDAGLRALLAESRTLEEALQAVQQPALEGVDVERALSGINAGIDQEAARGGEALDEQHGSYGAAFFEDRIHDEDEQDLSEASSVVARRGARLALVPARRLLAAGVAAGLIGWAAIVIFDGGEPEHIASEGGDLAQSADETPITKGVAAGMTSAPVEEESPQDGQSGDPVADAAGLGTDFDAGRHEFALLEVQTALRTSWQVAAQQAVPEQDAIDGFIARFQVATAELRRAQWPVGRLVESCLQGEDAELVSAAARYLGRIAGESALQRLAWALDARRSDALTRAELTRALFDVGPAAHAALAAIYWRADEADEPLLAVLKERVLDLPDAQRIAWTRAALALGRRASSAQTAQRMDGAGTLMQSLNGSGVAGAELLFEHGDRAPLDRALFLQGLIASGGARDAIEDLLDGGMRRVVPELMLAAIEVVQPAGVLLWVRERCEDGQDVGAGLRVFASYPGIDPLLILLEPRVVRHASFEELAEAWALALEQGAPRLLELAQHLEQEEQGVFAERYLERLLLCADAKVCDALLALGGGELLAEDLRERALLAAFELAPLVPSAQLAAGQESDAGRQERAHWLRHLTTIYQGCSKREERMAAACIYGLHQFGGAAGADSALAQAPARLRQLIGQVLTRTEGRRGPTVTLVQLASLLQPALHAQADLKRNLQ